MNVEQALFRFIDFYLLPHFSQKSIDLLKLKLDRKAKKISDPLLRDAALVRYCLNLLGQRRRPAGQLLVPDTTVDRLYLQALKLSPRDCLILTSKILFPVPLDTLSLALKTSADSLEFRRDQMVQHFKEDGHELQELSQVVPAPAERRATPIRTSENLSILQNFQKLPLALRFTIETGLILMGLLGLLWLIPEIRNRYENSIQRRINDYLIESSLVDSPAPAGTTKTARPIATPNPDGEDEAEEAPAGVAKSSSDELSSRKQPRVNEGETWRFSFTGSATTEIETGVSDALQKLNLSSEKPLTVPGGIQFNFMMPLARVIPLKNSLEQLVSDIRQKATNPNTGGTGASFSWYKKRNMQTRKIPPGNVLVIIWISTL